MLAAAGPNFEPVGWQLGVDWAWRWGGLGVGLSWVGVAWGRAWVQLICFCLCDHPEVSAWPWLLWPAQLVLVAVAGFQWPAKHCH